MSLTPTAAAGSTFVSWSGAQCGSVMIMTTDHYCTATFNQVVSNKAPKAGISATPVSGIAPLTVMFDGSASSDIDGQVSGYAWNFGDGTSGSGATASHVYAKAGGYTATLSVTDNLIAVSSVAAMISVSQSASLGITLQPVNRSIREGMYTTFTVRAKGVGPLKYQWQKNAVDLPGAISRSYTTPAVSLNDTGAIFQCVVTDGQNRVVSNPATLVVEKRRH